MSFNYSYTKELEHLIVHTLLPVYTNYNKRMGISDRYAGIHPELLAMIKKEKQVPALLKPKENYTWICLSNDV